MYWTLELASYLSDAPWPATKDELIDFSIRTGAPLEVVENLQSMEDEDDVYWRGVAACGGSPRFCIGLPRFLDGGGSADPVFHGIQRARSLAALVDNEAGTCACAWHRHWRL